MMTKVSTADRILTLFFINFPFGNKDIIIFDLHKHYLNNHDVIITPPRKKVNCLFLIEILKQKVKLLFY